MTLASGSPHIYLGYKWSPLSCLIFWLMFIPWELKQKGSGKQRKLLRYNGRQGVQLGGGGVSEKEENHTVKVGQVQPIFPGGSHLCSGFY